MCVPSYCVRHILTVFQKKSKKTQKTYLLKEIKLKSLTHHLFSLEEKHRFLMEIYCFSTWNYISWKILHNFLINHSTLIYIIYLHIFFFIYSRFLANQDGKRGPGNSNYAKTGTFFILVNVYCVYTTKQKNPVTDFSCTFVLF